MSTFNRGDARDARWVLTWDRYEPERQGVREALCTLGNGYFATRGAAPEARADSIHYPGTYLAGGYNRLISEFAGQRVENEDLVNLPNWLCLSFRIGDGPWFALDEAEVLDFVQRLDLRHGILERDVRVRDALGRTTRWIEQRLVSMSDPHLAALDIALVAEDWSGEITIRSGLDTTVTNDGVARYRDLASRHLEVLTLEHLGNDTLFARCQTSQSRLTVAQALRTRLFCGPHEVSAERSIVQSGGYIEQHIQCALQRGDALRVEKTMALHCSRDTAISEPGLAALRSLGHAGGFDELRAAHENVWTRLWGICDIEIENGVTAETAMKLRANQFHLLQTVSPHSSDLDVGLPARSWHGEAYRGHVFWDELFVLPYLVLRLPTLARSLLRYRYRRLPEARLAAREAGLSGAMYPWQSGSDGREETQRMHLNPQSGRWLPDVSHRQRHVNSAIAYNVWKYYQATGDHEFLCSYGAEMLLEIARFWACMATYSADIDRYEIRGVMGPDEYHTGHPDAPEDGLANNAYTNVMAAWVLSRAIDSVDLMPELRRCQLFERIGMNADELALWQTISRKLRVPFHDGDIISQFDGYDALDEFDWDAYRAKYGDIRRLDRILEAENDTPNRYRLSKQADVLMLFYLFSAEELTQLFEQLGYPFLPDSIPRNVEYYLARTAHGSTLSHVVHSWVLARSDRQRSWDLFCCVLDSDLEDIQHGSTREGVHIGAMAGSVDLLQRCYLGLEMRGNTLHFDPVLPTTLQRIRATLTYRSQSLEVDADHERLRIHSHAFTSIPITIAYRGHYRDLAPGESCEYLLLRPEDRDRDENQRTAIRSVNQFSVGPGRVSASMKL